MKITGRKLDGLMFAFVVVDLMFLPYLRVLSSSASMVVLPFWFVFRGHVIRNDRDFRLCVLAIFVAILSFLVSFLKFPDGFLMRSGSRGSAVSMVPNTVILCYMFLYYMFFKSVISRYSFSVDRFLYFYLGFVLVLALLFYLDPAFYFEVRSFWTMFDNVIEVGEFENAMYRFTSTLSEPNNIAALVVSIYSYLVIYKDKVYSCSVALTVLLMLVVFATMSSSGMALMVLAVFVFVLKDSVFQNGVSMRRMTIKILSSIFFACVAILAFAYFQSTEVGEIASSRVSENSMDSRYRIWFNSIDPSKLMGSLIFGDGGLVVLNGKVVNPHNGHLHLIYSYGFLLYLVFIYIYFVAPVRINVRYFFVVPLLACFTINVGIYELRFAGLMALILAAARVEKINSLKTSKRNDGVLSLV